MSEAAVALAHAECHRSQEALHDRIIVAVHFSTHAYLNPLAREQSPIPSTGVFTSPIRVMQQSWMRAASTHCHDQCLCGELLIAHALAMS